MRSERTICIFFEDLTPKAQERIISTELMFVTNQDEVTVKSIRLDEEPYGYDPDPDKQEMLQDVHAKTSEGDFLMVWDCMDAEFQTVMKDNKAN